MEDIESLSTNEREVTSYINFMGTGSHQIIHSYYQSFPNTLLTIFSIFE